MQPLYCSHVSLRKKGGPNAIANVKVIEGVFSKEQKVQFIEKITEAMIEVEGEGMRPYTWVVIEEVKPGDWAIGGKPVYPKVKSNSP